MVIKEYKKIKKDIETLVQEACDAKSNKFGDSVWKFHIQPVVKNSLLLGKNLKADLKVLEISALLHDYAGIKDFKYYPEHHLYGAKIANQILFQYNLPEPFVMHVADCIANHRGSVNYQHRSIESKILASADAMSHITEIVDMFYLTFGVHKYHTKEGAQWLKEKLSRSYKKIMPAGKKLVKDDYIYFIKLLNNTIKK